MSHSLVHWGGGGVLMVVTEGLGVTLFSLSGDTHSRGLCGARRAVTRAVSPRTLLTAAPFHIRRRPLHASPACEPSKSSCAVMKHRASPSSKRCKQTVSHGITALATFLEGRKGRREGERVGGSRGEGRGEGG